MTLAIAHNSQRGEPELTATFYDFCNAINSDQLLNEVVGILILIHSCHFVFPASDSTQANN
jgi:hypothetical protein